MIEEMIKILTSNQFVTYELGDLMIGENEIAEVHDDAIYFYNTLTTRCAGDVKNWLYKIFEDFDVTINQINCCCGEDYWEVIF